jgi:broad specificity phosphatase PhoE
VTTLYLIRHGQAGTRDNYDLLSEVGQQQAQLLGAHLAAQKITWRAFYTGGLWRQQQTAQIVSAAFSAMGQTIPELIVNEQWNEFSLTDVYRGLTPLLKVDSAAFACDYEEMQAALASDPRVTRGAAGRCDRVVIKAWMENRYSDYDGESWGDFRARVQGIREQLMRHETDEHIAVFTSATPIAIWVGTALALADEKIPRLMAVLYNASVTTLKLRPGELLLLDFNTTPHLPDAVLRTFR